MHARRLAHLVIAGTLLAVPGTAPLAAQSAQQILETARAKQAARYADVRNYTITKAIEVAGGMQAPMYYERFDDPSLPEPGFAFRLVLPPEYERQQLTAAGFPPPPPEAREAMASGLDFLGPALARGGGDMPPLPIAPMTDAMSTFLRASAAAERNENDGRADATQTLADMAEFARLARVAGTEVVAEPSAETFFPEGGSTYTPGPARAAWVLEVNDYETTELTGDGGTFSIDRARLWIDQEHHVPLRLMIEGKMTRDRKSSPLVIEKLNLDYRQVGPLYEPHLEAFRLSGILQGMSEKERREMEEARVQLAEAQAQLAAMPDGPGKRIAMRVMGPQIEKFKKMVEGDNFATTVRVASIAVNEGPPTPYGTGRLDMGGAHGGAFTKALTLAAEDRSGGAGPIVAQLSVTAAYGDDQQVSLGLIGAGRFPGGPGVVAVVDARGNARSATGGVSIEGGTGIITVTDRTGTRIAGEFEVALHGTDDQGNAVQFTASGEFDTGAPSGPYQAPRGSPFPADLFREGGGS